MGVDVGVQWILQHQNKLNWTDFNIQDHASVLRAASGTREGINEVLVAVKSCINGCLKVPKSATGASPVLAFECGQRAKVKLWIALQILQTVFLKSRTFREAIIDSPLLALLLEFALSISFLGIQQLSSPNSQELQILTLVCSILSQWTAVNFTASYPKLIVFKDRVEKSGVVEKSKDIIARIQSADAHVSAEAAARMDKSNAIRLKKYLGLVREWGDYKASLLEHQTLLESLLEIVHPPDDLFGAVDDAVTTPNPLKDTLHPPSFSMTITLDDSLHTRITETAENRVLFDQIREQRRVLMGLQEKLIEWLSLATKVTDIETQRYETFMRDLINVKASVHRVLKESSVLLDEAGEEEMSDVEFEEVDDSFQFSEEQHLNLDDASKMGKRIVDNSKIVPVYSFTGLKPVFTTSHFTSMDEPDSSRRKAKSQNPLFDEAPIVDWQPDLDHWSSKQVTFADITTHAGLEFKHRFLGESTEPSHDKVVGSAVLDKLRKRLVVVEDTGPGVAVEYPICGVRLRNGKGLCQRRDMEKCPFHGLIKPRDEKGDLIDLSSDLSETKKGTSWEEIEQDILIDPLQGGPSSSNRYRGGRRGMGSASQKPRGSTRSRLEKKSARISSRAAKSGIADGSKLVNELVARDKQVFKW